MVQSSHVHYITLDCITLYYITFYNIILDDIALDYDSDHAMDIT